MAGRRAIGGMALAIIIVLVVAVIAAAILLSLPSTSSTPGGSGKMAVIATDPYSSAGGNKQYMRYNNVGAHKAGSGSTSTTTSSSSSGGWVNLNVTGTLQLNTLVNASQTVALANVPAHTYDSIRFYVDSTIVTYNNQNYTATGSTQISAMLSGNVQVNSGSTTEVLFDMRTVAVNSGSSSNPSFVFESSARAEVVSSSDVDSSSLQVGARTDLSAKAWFQSFASGNAHLVITTSAISSNSLSVKLKDTGSESSNATLVVVTPVSILGSANVVIPPGLDGSAVFQVNSGGSLQITGNVAALLTSGSGATVYTSSSPTFTYSGNFIQFGPAVPPAVVVSGQSYLITVIGNNSVASSVVTAT